MVFGINAWVCHGCICEKCESEELDCCLNHKELKCRNDSSNGKKQVCASFKPINTPNEKE